MLLTLSLLWAVASPPAASPAGTRLEKMAHLLELEDRRDLGDGQLDRYLHDADAGVRRRAALAAGRIGDAALAPSMMENGMSCAATRRSAPTS